jgi:hypothetical protein
MTTLLAPSPVASTVTPTRPWKIDARRGQLDTRKNPRPFIFAVIH